MEYEKALKLAVEKVERQNAENVNSRHIKYVLGESFETDDFFIFDIKFEKIATHDGSYGGTPAYKISKLNGETSDISWGEYSNLKNKPLSDSLRFLKEFLALEGEENVRIQILKALAAVDVNCEKMQVNFDLYAVIIMPKMEIVAVECVFINLPKNIEEYSFEQFFDAIRLIEINEKKSFSQPSLVGRRLTVADVVRGMYFDSPDYAETHNLSKVEVDAVYRYCEIRKCLSEPEINHCDGCLLRGLKTQKANAIEVKLPFIINESDTGYLDAKGNAFDEEIGIPLWGIAKYLNSQN